MNRTLGLKLTIVAVLTLLLLIPLSLIRGLVAEREARRDQVVQDIAASSSRAQRITGPILVVPFRKSVRVIKVNPATQAQVEEVKEERRKLYFLPEDFRLDAELRTELRARGIYTARLFHARGTIRGRFAVPRSFGITEGAADCRFETPYLTLGLSDIRGIESVPQLAIDGKTLAFEPGTLEPQFGHGVHVPLTGLDLEAAGQFDFTLELALAGTGQLELSPVGRQSEVTLQADWPHPSFIGEFLPVERQVQSSGFTARWATTSFATNLEELMRECVVGADCSGFQGRRFGVSLIDPVDHYLKSERALKYGLLFVGLTFAAFFLFEGARGLPVHPIQYGMVGLALALFYLLLLSLSEHVGFVRAYVLSSGACIGLIGYYAGSVLKSLPRGLGFGGALGLLYALLYGLLRAEDYALLMGSLLLFALLAVVMSLTRRIDWELAGRPREGV